VIRQLFFAPGDRPAGAPAGQVPFQAHVELLHLFLAHRDGIVNRLEGVLNAQRKPAQYLRDRPLLSRQVEDCFFTGVTESQSRLRGQLEDAHWSSGFRPREMPGVHNGLADPAEMMTRGFHLWQQTRWPGRNGRVRYAHTLFNLYVIRCLELLSMRIWDAGSSGAGDRFWQVRDVLDRLWSIRMADQPRLVGDARWLLPLAQSPATDDLGAYFDVAARIEALPVEDRLEIHKAGVCMTAGHLRSQIRYYANKKGVAFDDAGVILITRTSNALDFALLVQDLVPLLEAYEKAWSGGDDPKRLELADVIGQAVSPDPELFLNRVELLAAYSMIEHLFITTEQDGHAAYTPMGQRHVRLLEEYGTRIRRVLKPLHDDCSGFRPVAGRYSPYGLLYGFSSHLVEHMVLKALQPDAATDFRLEDVFSAGDADKLAWVAGWRKLPHIRPEVERLFEYPQQFADGVFDRLERELARHASGSDTTAVAGRLFILTAEQAADPKMSQVPDLPARYIGSSDTQVVAAQFAEFCDEPRLQSDRQEARCILSYRTAGGWVAITKAILTEVSGTGQDVKIVGLPPAAAEVLSLMCPALVVPPGATQDVS